jgi:ribosomal-protein-alanine N-acetyltransferase
MDQDSPQIRWVLRQDLQCIATIELDAFKFPKSDVELERYLKRRDCAGLVVACGDTIIGFILFEFTEDQLQIVDFAIVDDYRRRGIGTMVIDKLKKQMLGQIAVSKRSKIMVLVRETNLVAQLFFRKNGFKSGQVIRGHYRDEPEDAYLLYHDLGLQLQQV